jgi:uncharacterized protein (DUF1697 family)
METMSVVIAMLRGVNVGGNKKLNMEALRTLCAGLGLRDVKTYIQSGNLIFRDDTGDAEAAARRIEDAIQKKFGFRPDVIVRTASDLSKVIANNPFAGRPEVAPNRLLAVFMAGTPSQQARKQVLAIPGEPEELHIKGRELYIYYPNGMAHPKIPLVRIEKLLATSSTGRNWNTVNKLLAMAKALEDQEV